MDKAGARTFLYDFGTARYNAACTTVLGRTGELRYSGDPNKRNLAPPAADVYWARIGAKMIAGGQETLRLNTKRYFNIGQVFVELFCPVTDSKALDNCDRIGEIILTGLRTTQGEEIEFTNAWINDNVADEPQWIRANVIADYAYRQFL